MTLQERAKLAAKYFQQKTRENGSTFYCYTEDAPESIKELARAIHGNMFPDDYKFQFIVEALKAIEDEGEDASLEPECYNSALIDWLGSYSLRPGYVDQASEDYGHFADGIMQSIIAGYNYEQMEVLNAVMGLLEDLDLEDETEGAA